MALSLDDILKLPVNPSPEHLAALGLLTPPPMAAPMVPSATVGKLSPVSPTSPAPSDLVSPDAKKAAVAALTPPAEPKPETETGVAAMVKPTMLHHEPTESSAFANNLSEPILPPVTRPEILDRPVGSLMSFESRQHTPDTVDLSTPAGQTPRTVEPGSAEFWQNRIARQEDAREHPWGSPENHPGLLGKIAHIAAKVGNIAGDVVAPNVMANVPGTDLHRNVQEAAENTAQGEAQARETAADVEKTREKHEENVEETNAKKIDQAQEKIDETERKDKSAREVQLRRQGLKLDGSGNAVPLQYEDMSPAEQAVHDLKVAQADAQVAKGMVDRIKADPNSPQNAAIRERLKIMAQNAGTAAEKLHLDKKKFLADYMGTDENGEPLTGVETTPEGKPVGPRITNANKSALASFNKDYVKPAEDVEKSYQMMDKAFSEYKAAQAKGEQLPSGAQAMVALSTHLSTTFGQVKGARITKDMIQHHLGARSISDDAEVAINKLVNGDPLSEAQWDAFHDLIGQSRKLSWQTAVKEGKRANQKIDFLPQDLQGELGGGEGKKKELPF